MTIKAVIFDIGDKRRVCYDVTTNIFEGGVCVGSPMAGIHAYEQKHGLPRNYINVAMYVWIMIFVLFKWLLYDNSVRQGENGAFQVNIYVH